LEKRMLKRFFLPSSRALALVAVALDDLLARSR
jgi:hypothetical protein